MQFIVKVNKGPGTIERPDTVFYTHCEFTKFPYLIFRGSLSFKILHFLPQLVQN